MTACVRVNVLMKVCYCAPNEQSVSLQPTKNYVGMVLRENVLYGVYKLNGVEHQMKTGYITKSPSEPAKFDRVDLYR